MKTKTTSVNRPVTELRYGPTGISDCVHGELQAAHAPHARPQLAIQHASARRALLQRTGTPHQLAWPAGNHLTGRAGWAPWAQGAFGEPLIHSSQEAISCPGCLGPHLGRLVLHRGDRGSALPPLPHVRVRACASSRSGSSS